MPRAGANMRARTTEEPRSQKNTYARSAWLEDRKRAHRSPPSEARRRASRLATGTYRTGVPAEPTSTGRAARSSMPNPTARTTASDASMHGEYDGVDCVIHHPGSPDESEARRTLTGPI